jgi:hypothetical protein
MNKAIQLLSIIALFGIIGFFYQHSQETNASVALANDYQSVTLSSANASATVPLVIATTTQAFGSVIITTTHATVLRFYDGIASSTAPQTATSTGRLLGTMKASIGENTYTFDTITKYGVIADIPSGYAGTATVTYR